VVRWIFARDGGKTRSFAVSVTLASPGVPMAQIQKEIIFLMLLRIGIIGLINHEFSNLFLF
jgi:hypothetical protein